jgi:hypothetical protein
LCSSNDGGVKIGAHQLMEVAASTFPLVLHLQVTAHPQCVARITIQPNPETGGDEFAVTGVAVIPFSTAAPVNPIDHADMNAGRAAGNQLPVSWP